MDQVDPNQKRLNGRWATLAIAAITGVGVITIALPTTMAMADPAPPPPAPAPADPNGPDAAPGPAGPNAVPPGADAVAAPPGIDPNVPAPPATDPNAPEPGRIDSPAGGFSYVIPAGWVESDATHLDYGSALLSRQVGLPVPGQPPPVANDTRVVLGKLDQRLYASAEADNAKAASRLASDMGEFFMPYPGTRINQDTTPLTANGMSGSASYYEVKFSDASKPNGQIWAGVIGPSGTHTPGSANQRWFVVWLGTANDPVDKAAATTLAQSVRPLTPPPAAGSAVPAAAPPVPAAAPPVPAAPPPVPAAPPPAPVGPPPGQPAGESSPGSVPAPPPALST
jgi:fibronectin-attachment protein (FAP)